MRTLPVWFNTVMDASLSAESLAETEEAVLLHFPSVTAVYAGLGPVHMGCAMMSWRRALLHKSTNRTAI